MVTAVVGCDSTGGAVPSAGAVVLAGNVLGRLPSCDPRPPFVAGRLVGRHVGRLQGGGWSRAVICARESWLGSRCILGENDRDQ